MNKRNLSFLIIAVLILGGGWIWFSRVTDATAETARPAIPLPGHPAPDFALQTLDGQTLTLSDLTGQAVVLNFWASWCPPCRAEMPELEQAYQDNQNGGLVVLGVNQGEQQAVAADFVQQFGLTFPVVLDQDLFASRIYKVNSLPTTFFIDRNGVIQDRVTGQMNTALLDEKLRTIFP
ncbi:MAG TPA: TlpA family protein disulfide reductase [Caldilineae bacterium]|nr:TlpA family protein disulfide reductase [Caldilineae bacterium]